MRQKKRYRVISFEQTTDAMAMEQTCLAREIPGRLIPTPTEITAGCGLAWRMREEDYQAYEEQLPALGLAWSASDWIWMY